MGEEESILLNQWLADASFINWAKNIRGEDFAYWEAWLEAHPDQRELAETGRQVIAGIPFHRAPADQAGDEQALNALWQTIREQEAATVIAVPRRLYQRWSAVAAGIAILITSVVALMYFQSAQAIAIHTGYSEKQEITLPDGSQVVLNANSSLRYYKSQPREIWLTGEAYFKVAKQPETQAKFHVRTPDLAIEVLGTAFNVKSRDDRTTVFLDEGKVRLDLNQAPGEEELLMDPGELVSYSAKNAQNLLREKSPRLVHTSWQTGVMLLESQPLHSVLKEIEAIYGIEIELRRDSLRDHVLTVALPIASREIALETLEHGLGLRITKVDDTHYYFE